MVKTLFDETTLGGIRVKNRLVRSATFEYGADEEGRFNQNIHALYKDLAAGGVGLIISGMVGIDTNSRIAPFMAKAYDNSFTADLQKLTELVHAHGSRLLVQIAHCGAVVQETDEGKPAVGMSSIPEKDIRPLSAEDISQLVNSFAQAAIRCKEAGADGVQIHGSHGYLLSQSLSPLYNHRSDEYGGSLENRARLLFAVYHSVRSAVGKDYPIWVKINASDVADGGLSFDESLWVCKQLSEKGVDAIEVSGGISLSLESAPIRAVSHKGQEGYFSREALAIAESVDTDIVSVGGYRSPELLEQKLNAGSIQGLSMSRPFISEPGLANRWHSGQLEKARCISCSKCFAPGNLSCKVFP